MNSQPRLVMSEESKNKLSWLAGSSSLESRSVMARCPHQVTTEPCASNTVVTHSSCNANQGAYNQRYILSQKCSHKPAAQYPDA